MTRARQRLRGMIIGFVFGAVGSFVLWFAFLLHDLALPYFEPLYEARRPHGLLAMLRFNLHVGDVMLYLSLGVVGAVVGLATSGRPLANRIIAIPGLALVGTILITSAHVNYDSEGEQPLWLLVAVALAGVVCVGFATLIAFRARPSRVRSAPRRRAVR
jgi:hypothetical protein